MTSSTIGCDGAEPVGRVAHRLEQAAVEVGCRRAAPRRGGRTARWRRGHWTVRRRARRARRSSSAPAHADRQPREPAARRAVSPASARTADARAPETKTGTILASACTAMRAMARNSRNALASGSTAVGQIDGEPPLALQHAHQPPADEDMLGVEGDGAGKLAPRLQPDAISPILRRGCAASAPAAATASAPDRAATGARSHR